MKILIGVVTANIKDYCWSSFKTQLNYLISKGFDVYIVDNSKMQMSRPYPMKWVKPNNVPQLTTMNCMNELRDYFLKGSWDKLWILESDVFINDEGIERLLNMKGDVCNLTYPMRLQRFDRYSLCVQSTIANHSLMITPEESKSLIGNGVIELGKFQHHGKIVTHSGYGCTLIDRKVLEQIKFRTDKSGDKYPFPDSYFHKDVNSKGFVNLLDTDYICEHRNLKLETEKEVQKMKYAHIPRKLRRKLNLK